MNNNLKILLNKTLQVLPKDMKEPFKFDNLKILFYGPANTEDKNNIDINLYDVVFITNNMINIFFKKYDNIKTKIILLSNEYFSLNNSNDIVKNINKVFLIYVSSLKALDFLKKIKLIKIPILMITNNSNFKVIQTPLGLTRVLMLLENEKYNSINVVGCTFYNDLNTVYEKNYQLLNPFEELKKQHNLNSNIEYLKYFIANNKIIISPELSLLL